VLVGFFHFDRNFLKIGQMSPTHSNLHTENEQNTNRTSYLRVEEFLTLHVLSLSIFHPSKNLFSYKYNRLPNLATGRIK
jgi:hypothetical protein